jgi:hypothetical protein
MRSAGRSYGARPKNLPRITRKREKIRTTYPRILALLERVLLGEILGDLCAFAVNGVSHFHREGAKDAK